MFQSTKFVPGAVALAALVAAGPALSLMPTAPPPPRCEPVFPDGIQCVKSVSLLPRVPRVFLVPNPLPMDLEVDVLVNTTSGSNGGLVPPMPCLLPPSVLGGFVQVTVTGPDGPFTGSMPIGSRPSGFQSGNLTVPITIPPAALPGLYGVQVDAAVNFSDGAGPITATANGSVCIVDPLPGTNDTPALDAVIINSPQREGPPGDQTELRLLVTNNDTTPAVVQVTVESTQAALMPGGPGAFSISATSGDDFPIAFKEDLPADGVLPAVHSTIQPVIIKTVTLEPGESQVVDVATRSFPACGPGSCSIFQFHLEDLAHPGRVACVTEGLSVNPAAEFLPLYGHPGTISLSTGGTQYLSMNFGSTDTYVLATSFFGPDITVLGKTLPLSNDWLLDLSLDKADPLHSMVFSGTCGNLKAGIGQAELHVPPLPGVLGLPPIRSAFVLLDTAGILFGFPPSIYFVSDPALLKFVP